MRKAQYLHPFTHQFGKYCLLPQSTIVLQAFATKLYFYQLEDLNHSFKEIDLPITSRIKEFTFQLDLESSCCVIHADHFHGYIDARCELLNKKPPKIDGVEKLCFGMSKKQEIEKIMQRKELKELLPLWYRLAQLMPTQSDKQFSLIQKNQVEPKDQKEALITFFQATLTDLFFPRTDDIYCQRLHTDVIPTLSLIQQGYAWIRSLFFQKNGEEITLLPNSMPYLPHGRLYQIQTEHALIDIQWSKKKIRKVIFDVQKPHKVRLKLQDELKSYRVNKEIRQQVEEPLIFTDKGKFVCDRFEK